MSMATKLQSQNIQHLTINGQLYLKLPRFECGMWSQHFISLDRIYKSNFNFVGGKSKLLNVLSVTAY